MVAVEHQTPQQLRRSVEIILPVLVSWWNELPDVLSRIESWDLANQIDYIEEWTHLESKRHTVEVAAARGLLTSDQQKLYDQLQDLVATHGDDLGRLLSS